MAVSPAAPWLSIASAASKLSGEISTVAPGRCRRSSASSASPTLDAAAENFVANGPGGAGGAAGEAAPRPQATSSMSVIAAITGSTCLMAPHSPRPAVSQAEPLTGVGAA